MIDFKNRDIISISDLTPEEILYLCEKGMNMYALEKAGGRYQLKFSKPKKMGLLFYEPSTRTRTSFETDMLELDGTVTGFVGTEGTSVMKKESIRDTVMMYWANHCDALVMRHPLDGSVQWAADVVGIPVINGGDGKNEHPTQALLDMLALYMFNNKKLDGINLGLGGDLAHGRTIRSLCLALSHFNNIAIRWAAEDIFGMPKDLEQSLIDRDVKVIREKSVEDVLKASDFYYMSRYQFERMTSVIRGEVIKRIPKYRITADKVRDFKGKLFHPLPVDGEVSEIDSLVYVMACFGAFDQAQGGVFSRKGLVYDILSGEDYIPFNSRLSTDLVTGNNRLKRAYSGKFTKGRFIDDIPNGISLDHLLPGAARQIDARLDLASRGHSSVPAQLAKGGKSFFKSDLTELTERELKIIAMISPDPTVNYIREDKVVDKFVYLLCKNDNCVTSGVLDSPDKNDPRLKALMEDVPPKFYYDGQIRCRYCRRPYELANPKVSQTELEGFKRALPTKV